MDTPSVTSRVALVTGAGAGIGKSVGLALIDDGFHVVLSGRTEATLQETAAAASDPKKAHVFVADVTSADAVVDLFQFIENQFGRLDLAFNNAGIGLSSTPIEDVSIEDWKRVVDTNLTGVFLCSREAVRLMKKQRPMGGRIINNGSVSAQVPRPDSVAYTATKHGVTGITKSLSLDGRKYNICCGQIDIGNALTDMAAPMKAGVPQADGSIAIEPTIDPNEVAQAIVQQANLPLGTNVPFMTIMANRMPLMGRG